ncbi:MAG: hypothetical protein ACFFDF_25560, partial [Candidatus Odinarchaeota archaeon]
MRFISGLKNLSKKTILFIIVVLFVISWFLFTFGLTIFENFEFGRYLIYFLIILAGFTFILFIISFIKPIDKIGIIVIIIAALLTLPVIWLFTRIILLFSIFCYVANIIVTAFFAYKFCMDTSIKIDDYFYKNKRSRIFTRIIEFIIFFILNWLLVLLIIKFFSGFGNPHVQNLARIFLYLFLINTILIGFTLIRLIFTKRIAAYVTLFNLLTFFYVLYIIINLWVEFIFPNNAGYDLLSFSVDFLLFVYIIGSIYDRVDYFKDKLKIFRVDTIALFLILMKLIVQIIEILREFLPPIDLIPGNVL